MRFLTLGLTAFFSLSVAASDILNNQFKLADGGEIDLKSLKGKPFMIVNIATKCGLTGQLDGLQSLYDKYKEKGFSIIGIPSNEFAGQTPEGNKEVSKFCRLKYGTNFPITNKQIIKGRNKISLYKNLIKESNQKEIGWNFTKFLVDRKGNLVHRFEPQIEPMNTKVIAAIEEVL